MELHTDITELAAQLGCILANNKLWITTAESCTGGGISFALTDTPGSSRYIDRCFVTYSNEAKQTLLDVNCHTIEHYGAVSEETVKEMVSGALKQASAQCGISVSGIAGPGGGSTDKPVGTVWFAFKVHQKIFTFKHMFLGDRAKVRAQAIDFSIRKMIELLKQENYA